MLSFEKRSDCCVAKQTNPKQRDDAGTLQWRQILGFGGRDFQKTWGLKWPVLVRFLINCSHFGNENRRRIRPGEEQVWKLGLCWSYLSQPPPPPPLGSIWGTQEEKRRETKSLSLLNNSTPLRYFLLVQGQGVGGWIHDPHTTLVWDEQLLSS